MRTRSILSLVSIVMLLGAWGCSTLHKSDSAALQGTWTERETQANQESPYYLVISGAHLEYHGAQPTEWAKGTFTLREDTRPKQLVLAITQCGDASAVGKICHAIYRLEARTLTLTVNAAGNPAAPSSFDAPDTTRFILKKSVRPPAPGAPGSFAANWSNDFRLATGSSFVVEVAEDYNRLFYREDGWSGSDIAFSLPLLDGRILWLYGDTWIGEIREGRHTNATMVSNTLGIQQGLDPASARLDFFHGSKDAKPAAFIQPADGVGEFWLSHGGIQTDKGLYLFMSRMMKRPGDTSGDVSAVGIVMAKITNPLDDPNRWRIEQINVPWARYDAAGNEKVFGLPLLREGNTVYLYGLEMDALAHDRYLLVARANVASLEDFSTWEFYTRGRWQRDFRKASRLCNHLGAELSVSFLPRLKRYLLIYTEGGLSEKIMLRFAPSPVGPWSAAATIYRTPEMSWDSTYFCYAAKAHPELSRRDDELLVSYVCNSTDFWKNAGDARIYFPKFLRVRFTAVPASGH
jgi:uncharacterized protein (TIGR03067 family)